MIAHVEQRWHGGRTRWVRPDRALFGPSLYDVDRCGEADAKRFVVEHHYAHTYRPPGSPMGSPSGRPGFSWESQLSVCRRTPAH